MKIKFLGDQTLIRVEGVKKAIKGGDVVYVDKEYGEELLTRYADLFVVAPDEVKKNVAKVEAPKAAKTTAKLSTYSKAKK
jgi:hypothetical protein